MITDEQLDKWQELADKATEGPWEVDGRDCDFDRGNLYTGEQSGLGYEIIGPPEPMLRGQFGRYADAALIAESRTAVPLLVAEVRRLNSVLVEAARNHRCACTLVPMEQLCPAIPIDQFVAGDEEPAK